METQIDKSGSFVVSQFLEPKGQEGAPHPLAGPTVTISHQAGSGVQEVAGRLAAILQETVPGKTQPWKVLDRQMVERALEEHRWPSKLAQKIPEEKRSYVEDVLDDLFGLRPPSWVVIPQIAETMLHLAKAGHVILIGHGATVVTRQLPNVYHVRLVAPLATRIERVRHAEKLTAKAAAALVRQQDLGRRQYVKANFHASLEDSLLYDLLINTGRTSLTDAAEVIAEGAWRCFRPAPEGH